MGRQARRGICGTTFMFSKNIYVDGLVSDAKYVFQYCQNVEIHHAKITTKDSFWECDYVVTAP